MVGKPRKNILTCSFFDGHTPPRKCSISEKVFVLQEDDEDGTSIANIF
jgi:hypothetical protein